MQKIRSYLIVLLLLFSMCSYGQTTTNSPYSKYGLGVLRSESFNQNFGFAGTGIGLRSSTDLDIINPASLSELGITTFELGFTNNALWLSSASQSQFQNNSSISHIAFGFPIIKNKWGMALGALPYTSVGYNYSTTSNNSIAGDVSYYYQGNGGLNKVFLANAIKFNIDSTSLVSIGYNFSYIFGNINYDKKIIFGGIPYSFNLWETLDNHISDFTSDFGLQYQKAFVNASGDKYLFTIGATYALAANLHTKQTKNIRTFTGNIDFGTLKDTISYTPDVNEITEMPAKIGGGLSFEKDKKWIIAVDVKTTNWSAIQSPQSNMTYKNNYTISAGYQITPKYDAFNNYFKRMRYKFGARYSTAYYSINNTDINEYGITFGIGLPLKRTDTSLPGLNFGVEAGNRGVSTNGLVKETFVNFNVGLTINDRWFIKRKYD